MVNIEGQGALILLESRKKRVLLISFPNKREVSLGVGRKTLVERTAPSIFPSKRKEERPTRKPPADRKINKNSSKNWTGCRRGQN